MTAPVARAFGYSLNQLQSLLQENVGMDMRLRVEFFFDPEAKNWNFRVPALGIISATGCGQGQTGPAAGRDRREPRR
jgi:hypothetical protein